MTTRHCHAALAVVTVPDTLTTMGGAAHGAAHVSRDSQHRCDSIGLRRPKAGIRAQRLKFQGATDDKGGMVAFALLISLPLALGITKALGMVFPRIRGA